jgi:NADH-quinone oxidoreductase subunit L
VPVDSLQVDLAFLADPLSITMCLFVTGISALIHLYAVGYMHGDQRFSKFFLYLNLFVLSMLLLVLGENLLVTFLGWEGVGTCSYFLISFWHERNSAATAGKKAFITNRVGDWGFMIAMFLAFQAVGTISYGGLNAAAEAGGLAESTSTAIALLLFVGAVGKSAQLPLYFWLPDAMEGPTPVSALIHAATMVTAGVFLMTRVNPVLEVAADWAPTLIAIIGAATAFFAATIAVAQNDIKRVLAYSTVSQLGYMFLAIGSGRVRRSDLPHGDRTRSSRRCCSSAQARSSTACTAAGHAPDGSAARADADHRDHVHHRLARDRRCPAVRRASGARTRSCCSRWRRAPVLYRRRLVTALLTAYYMTRQVIMVFFGEARWKRPRGRARRPRRRPPAREPGPRCCSRSWCSPAVGRRRSASAPVLRRRPLPREVAPPRGRVRRA